MAKKGGGSGSKATSLPAGEHWRDEPEDHDYPAAAAYLSLLCPPPEVKRLVASLRAAPLEHRLAKDLLRASRLALLPADNPHVATDLAKVKAGERLSPVLLVRGDVSRDVPMTIADGYHRVCASYHLDENAPIPCHLAAPGTTRSRDLSWTRSSRSPTAVQ